MGERLRSAPDDTALRMRTVPGRLSITEPTEYGSPMRRARMRRDEIRTAIAGLLASVLVGTGTVAATTIAEIVAQPGAFANAAVTVTGTVTAQRRGPFAGASLFTLEDEGKRVTVLSKQDAPAVGSRVEVHAKVGFSPPDEEFTWPPLLLETAQRSVP